jgi:hypothetical protein
MQAFFAAVVTLIGIAFVASQALETQQRTADVAYTSKTGARVDSDPRLSGGVVQKH